MVQQVITKQIQIGFPGEVQTFQIKLPEHTISVIGVETGCRMIDEYTPPAIPVFDFRTMLAFNRCDLVGELKLQSCESANIFYSTYVKSETNAGFGDFSRIAQLPPKEYLHQLNREEVPVCVHGKSTIVRAFYKDRLSERMHVRFSYVLSVHLWIETEQKEVEVRP